MPFLVGTAGIWGIKWLLRISFFVVAPGIKRPSEWPSGVHVLNNDGRVPWLLLAVLPHKDLIVALDAFLSQNFYVPFCSYWVLCHKSMASAQPI